jgi:hypothetical protein
VVCARRSAGAQIVVRTCRSTGAQIVVRARHISCTLEGECEKHPTCARSVAGTCSVAIAHARRVDRACRVACARRVARTRYVGNHVQMGWMKER